MTEQEIMKYISKYGNFGLTWHYRVDATRDVCNKLVKKGVLKRTYHAKGFDRWEPVMINK